VRRIVEIARGCGREVATPDEARRRRGVERRWAGFRTRDRPSGPEELGMRAVAELDDAVLVADPFAARRAVAVIGWRHLAAAISTEETTE